MATFIHGTYGYITEQTICQPYTEPTICQPYTEPTYVGHRRSRFPWSDIDGADQTHMIPSRACGITGVTQ